MRLRVAGAPVLSAPSAYEQSEEEQSSEEENDDNDCGLVDTNEEDWVLQVALATSLKEAHNSNTLPLHEQSLLGWADAVLAMASIGTATETDVVIVRDRLRLERFRVDVMAAQRGQDDYRAARQRAVDMRGNPDDRLALLFEQNTDLMRDLSKARGRCLKLCRRVDSNGMETLDADSRESLYFFLNEKILRSADLANDANLILAHLQTFQGGKNQQRVEALVPSMISWLVLENEWRSIEKAIHALLSNEFTGDFNMDATPPRQSGELLMTIGGPSPLPRIRKDGAGVTRGGFEEPHELEPARGSSLTWVQYVDEDSGCYYYCNALTGESQWEPPEAPFTPLPGVDKDVEEDQEGCGPNANEVYDGSYLEERNVAEQAKDLAEDVKGSVAQSRPSSPLESNPNASAVASHIAADKGSQAPSGSSKNNALHVHVTGTSVTPNEGPKHFTT